MRTVITIAFLSKGTIYQCTWGLRPWYGLSPQKTIRNMRFYEDCDHDAVLSKGIIYLCIWGLRLYPSPHKIIRKVSFMRTATMITVLSKAPFISVLRTATSENNLKNGDFMRTATIAILSKGIIYQWIWGLWHKIIRKMGVSSKKFKVKFFEWMKITTDSIWLQKRGEYLALPFV